MSEKKSKNEWGGIFVSGIALLFVLILLVYIPLFPRKDYLRLKGDVDDLRDTLKLAKMERLDAEISFKSQDALKQQLEQRPQNFDLFAFLDQKLQAAGLADNYQLDTNTRTRSSSARQTMVKLDLNGVTLKELIDLLHSIYDSNNLVVLYKLDRMRPTVMDKGIDCSMTFATIKG